MVVTNTLLNQSNQESLDLFDSVTHMAFGTGTATPLAGTTNLTNEVYRTIIFERVKDLSNSCYDFTGRIPITELNTQTITEVGLFDDAISGNKYAHTLVSDSFSKTNDDEYLITIRVKFNAVDV